MTTKQIKITRQELEQGPDLEAAEKAYIWLKAHGSKIMAVILLATIAFSANVVIKGMREATLTKANDGLYAASLAFEKALNEQKWGTAERAKALADVAAKCDAVAAEFSGTKLAQNALFLKANAYFSMGDPLGQSANTQKAVQHFGEYLAAAKSGGSALEIAAATLALAFANENLYALAALDAKDAAAAEAEALKNFDAVIGMKEAGFLRAEAMNGKARILAFKGDKKGAEALYRQVLAERKHEIAKPADASNRRENMIFQLRTMADQFTAATSAKAALERMGIEVEEEKK